MNTKTRTKAGYRRVLELVVAALILIGVPALTTTPASASTPDPAIWIGSPVYGSWPSTAGCAGAVYPSASCSLPTVHHIAYATSYNWGTGLNDWAADLQSVTANSTPVRVYAAPVYSGYVVSARVDRVAAACASGVITDGGYQVQVGFYVGGLKVGSATYAHINPTVYAGQWIPRWGATVGYVGAYNWSSCWQGVHVHVELSSRHNYSCFSAIFTRYPGARIYESNFVGYIGGYYASGPRSQCA